MNILKTEDPRFSKFDVAFEGKIVGRAIVFIRPHPYQQKPVLELLELYVDPDHRKKGIARSLVKRVIEYAAKEDCLAVHLVTNDGPIAEQLYIPEGFEHKLACNYVCLLDKKVA